MSRDAAVNELVFEAGLEICFQFVDNLLLITVADGNSPIKCAEQVFAKLNFCITVHLGSQCSGFFRLFLRETLFGWVFSVPFGSLELNVVVDVFCLRFPAPRPPSEPA